MYKPRTAFATLLLGLIILFADKAGAQNLSTSKKPLPQLGKSPIKEIISAMTLEEKVSFVVGNGFKMPGAAPQGPARPPRGGAGAGLYKGPNTGPAWREGL